MRLPTINAPDHTQADLLIVAGLADGASLAAQIHETLNLNMPRDPEALLIQRVQWQGKPILLISGADDRGLMYALLDVVQRIEWALDPQTPLSQVHDIMETPAVVERALSKYTMHQTHFESYFFDEQYWTQFLDMLAQNRFNTFVLIFGYENQGYLTPAYPYFFNVEGFENVKVEGITPQMQQRYLNALNRLIDMTHQRGMDFTLGIWDHIYRQSDDATSPVVEGLTGENLMAYSTAALAKFLRLVPDFDALQCRMHGESGLTRREMPIFWEEIYQVLIDSGRDIRFDARAKNFPQSLIDKAIDMGVNIRIATKYWAEQMGLPYHPTHIPPQNQFDQRHGYGNLLRYPKKYEMHWRLWNCGTTRVLLWGDPDYVRRFADSTHLYGGQGFEVVEPMATKMWYHPHLMEPFQLLKDPYRYYHWEFERYWHFFQLFGRLGYNPDAPPEIWQREFEKRFGKDAAPYIEQALHKAGKILPRIVAYCMPYDDRFHTTGGWVEKQRREDLPDYAAAGASDTQQFLAISNAAKINLQGNESAKMSPQTTSQWFARASAEVLAANAEEHVGPHKSREFASTIVDLRILANLVLYHSRRVHAGISYASFDQSGDLHALDQAIWHERLAIKAWQQLVAAAGDVYGDDLKMETPRFQTQGHWRDELDALQKGLRQLENQRKNFRPATENTTINHVPIRKTAPGRSLQLWATVTSNEPVKSVRLAVAGNQRQVQYLKMKPSNDPLVYSAAIDAASVSQGLTYFIEAADQTGRTARYPEKGQSHPIAVTITDDNEPPALSHRPITAAPPHKPLTITAKVTDPSGVKWVRLRYRHLSQYEDYQTLDMQPANQKHHYQAVVPADFIIPEWDLMCLLEVMDHAGNGKIYPDLNFETPYTVVQLQR